LAIILFEIFLFSSFPSLFLSFAFDAVRYIANLPHLISIPKDKNSIGHLSTKSNTSIKPEVVDGYLLVLSVILRSIATFFLTLSLYHQLKYRSSGT